MKRLHHKVNIVPIIAKADSLTEEECRLLKQRVSPLPAPPNGALPLPAAAALPDRSCVVQILETIEEEKINVYRFPEESEVARNEDSILKAAQVYPRRTWALP
jgi:septin 7